MLGVFSVREKCFDGWCFKGLLCSEKARAEYKTWSTNRTKDKRLYFVPYLIAAAFLLISWDSQKWQVLDFCYLSTCRSFPHERWTKKDLNVTEDKIKGSNSVSPTIWVSLPYRTTQKEVPCIISLETTKQQASPLTEQEHTRCTWIAERNKNIQAARQCIFWLTLILSGAEQKAYLCSCWFNDVLTSSHVGSEQAKSFFRKHWVFLRGSIFLVPILHQPAVI